MKKYFFQNVSNPAKSCLCEKSCKKICSHLISSWATSSSKSTCWRCEKSVWIQTFIWFEPLNFGLWIQPTLETPERCVKKPHWGQQQKGEVVWDRFFSWGEAMQSHRSCCYCHYCFTDDSLPFPALFFPHLHPSLGHQRQQLITPASPTSFLSVSHTFLFSSCFERNTHQCQHRSPP